MKVKTIAIAISILLLSSIALAFPFWQNHNMQKWADESLKARIEKAIETKNYEEFVKIHTENNLRRKNITKEQFEIIAKNYELSKKIEAAIDDLDYKTWSELIAQKNQSLASKINEQNFPLLKELKEAKNNRDYTKVMEIKEKLGFIGLGKGIAIGNWKRNCPMND